MPGRTWSGEGALPAPSTHPPGRGHGSSSGAPLPSLCVGVLFLFLSF